MNFDNLKKTDPVCYNFVIDEMDRQETSLELIPSECIASLSTIEALWSPFTNKYSEWYAKKRYYWWNDVVDKVELLAIERAKEVFWVAHANVQPYSGSPANLAVYNAVCDAWDTTMGLSLTEWWHLTHWWKVSATSKYFNPVLYWLKDDGYIDLEEVERLAIEHKPKLIWVWATAYPREFPFEEFSRIAEKVWAYLAADIAHISWLVIAWVHKSPVPYVDIITTTTHKTLRWPRWGMIMVTDKWLIKDSDLAKKIDKAVFPWLQWWPHDHQTLAICVALW
jgi:glycine hydroxymethyltransferase